MPTQRRTPRVATRTSDVASGTRVHASSQVAIDETPLRQAAALSEALGVAGKAYEQITGRRHAKAFLLGSKAALEGRELTPEERERDSILLGYESIRTEREIVELRDGATALYQNSQNKHNPAALQAELDAFYASEFGDLDPEVDLDRAKFHKVRGAWGAIVETINTQAAAEAEQVRQDNMENDLVILARDEYANTGRLDWHNMHGKIMEDGRIPGSRANEILAAMARELAETGADPELIDSIPDHWPDGTATFKTIPRFAESLGSSRRAAENQRRYNDERAEREAAIALKQTQSNNAASIVGNIIGGASQRERVQQLVRTQGLEFETSMALIRFEESVSNMKGGANASDSGGVNYTLMRDLEIGLHTGTMTIDDVLRQVDDIGWGKDGGNAVSELLKLSKTVLDDRLQTPEAKNMASILAAEYGRQQGALTVNFDGSLDVAQRTHQAQALAMFNEHVLRGETVAKAAMRVRTEHPPLEARSKTMKPLEVGEIDALYSRGEIDDEQRVRLYELAIN